MLKQTSVATFMRSSNVFFLYLMLFAQYLPSALSKVATRSLLCYERLLSTRVSNPARVFLERAPVLLVGVVLGPALLSWVGVVFRPNVRRMEFGIFSIFRRLSSGLTSGDSCTSSDTSCLVPLWVSLMVALSVSRMYHQGWERKP